MLVSLQQNLNVFSFESLLCQFRVRNFIELAFGLIAIPAYTNGIRLCLKIIKINFIDYIISPHKGENYDYYSEK